jgi:hypothetical protein
LNLKDQSEFSDMIRANGWTNTYITDDGEPGAISTDDSYWSDDDTLLNDLEELPLENPDKNCVQDKLDEGESLAIGFPPDRIKHSLVEDFDNKHLNESENAHPDVSPCKGLRVHELEEEVQHGELVCECIFKTGRMPIAVPSEEYLRHYETGTSFYDHHFILGHCQLMFHTWNRHDVQLVHQMLNDSDLNEDDIYPLNDSVEIVDAFRNVKCGGGRRTNNEDDQGNS